MRKFHKLAFLRQKNTDILKLILLKSESEGGIFAMRRITSACLEQTIRFFDATGVSKPEDEFEAYKEKLERRRTKYSILDTRKDEDGSLLVKIKRQYNSYNMDDYL